MATPRQHKAWDQLLAGEEDAQGGFEDVQAPKVASLVLTDAGGHWLLFHHHDILHCYVVHGDGHCRRCRCGLGGV